MSHDVIHDDNSHGDGPNAKNQHDDTNHSDAPNAKQANLTAHIDVTYSPLVTKTVPALAALAGIIDEVALHVPAGWFVRLTTANATIGTARYY